MLAAWHSIRTGNNTQLIDHVNWSVNDSATHWRHLHSMIGLFTYGNSSTVVDTFYSDRTCVWRWLFFATAISVTQFTIKTNEQKSFSHDTVQVLSPLQIIPSTLWTFGDSETAEIHVTWYAVASISIPKIKCENFIGMKMKCHYLHIPFVAHEIRRVVWMSRI